MNIKFLGATQTVTGSKFLLTFNNKKILIDCGLFQGLKELRLRNWDKFPIDPAKIDAVILTHAHIDHSGYLPLLIKNGFAGKLYATFATKELCAILLPDSGFLQEKDAEHANRYGYSKHRRALPLYTKTDAEKVMPYFKVCEFDCDYEIGDLKICFKRAGHILGAAMVMVKGDGQKWLFSGDLGRFNDAMMYAPENFSHIEAPDYLVLESTYGAHLHNNVDPEVELTAIINRTAHRSGTLVIPAFAVGRTQTILRHVYHLKQQQKIPDLPVFVDSPMAKDVTDLWLQCRTEHKLSQEECTNIFKVAKYTNSVEESKELDSYKFPKIIISASGMATGGRILHHLRFYAVDRCNTILFVGHQVIGTRGAGLIAGAREVKLLGSVVPVRAEILELENISAHADCQEILTWLSGCVHAPKKTFLVHGEMKASLALKEKIENAYHWNCVIPHYLEEETLYYK